jgi:putative endonuclease
VEVKTRSSDQFGQPEEAVKKGKRGRMIKAANAYLGSTASDLAVRFDIVSIVLHTSGKHYIHHIPDAFYPTLHDKPR